ncbi:MAG: phosphoribosylpyrophosphate synthetase [Chitinophagales bacterium]|nr:phosphoribosylpyrophosphate synthetase [Chitinophagales bacterium]
METFETLTETIEALRKKGYIEDFNLKENCLECSQGKFKLFHSQFQIDSFYRFEGMTDPSDEMILYAISSPELNLKGTLVNAYGIYSDAVADEMVRKLNVR